jgi:hypothetical protein
MEDKTEENKTESNLDPRVQELNELIFDVKMITSELR